jgi:hypothetical protein
MEKDHSFALWNESFDRPFGNRSTWWSPGFRVSWKPLVEAIFSADYDKIGRLVGRANMDWLGNPESKDVETQHMRDGAPSALKMIGDCSPELVLPMDLKAFDVLKEFLKQKGFTIPSPIVSNFTVLISDAAKKRFHRNLYAFRAKSSEGRSFLVIKLPQHPARIFRADYATRCGMAVRKAAFQIDSGTPVDVEIT